MSTGRIFDLDRGDSVDGRRLESCERYYSLETVGYVLSADCASSLVTMSGLKIAQLLLLAGTFPVLAEYSMHVFVTQGIGTAIWFAVSRTKEHFVARCLPKRFENSDALLFFFF